MRVTFKAKVKRISLEQNSLGVYCPKSFLLLLTELAHKSRKPKIGSGEFSYPRLHRCLVACKAMDMDGLFVEHVP